MRVLIDTCVWTRFLRRGRPADDPVAEHYAHCLPIDLHRPLHGRNRST